MAQGALSMEKTWDQHEGEKHAQNGRPGMGGPPRSGAAGLGEGPFLTGDGGCKGAAVLEKDPLEIPREG